MNKEKEISRKEMSEKYDFVKSNEDIDKSMKELMRMNNEIDNNLKKAEELINSNDICNKEREFLFKEIVALKIGDALNLDKLQYIVAWRWSYKYNSDMEDITGFHVANIIRNNNIFFSKKKWDNKYIAFNHNEKKVFMHKRTNSGDFILTEYKFSVNDLFCSDWYIIYNINEDISYCNTYIEKINEHE